MADIFLHQKSLICSHIAASTSVPGEIEAGWLKRHEGTQRLLGGMDVAVHLRAV